MAVPGFSLVSAVALLLANASGGDAGASGMRVSDLLAAHPVGGTFTVGGYVAKAYRCPSCPPGAACKPCMGSNIVVSDSPRTVDSYEELGAGEAIVFVANDQLPKLVVGKRYRLRVSVGSSHTTSLGINDLQLLAAEPVQ